MAQVKRSGWHVVNEQEFKLTHQLDQAGFSNSHIAKVTGRSPTSVGHILKARNLEDYKAASRNRNSKYKVPTTSERPTTTVASTAPAPGKYRFTPVKEDLNGLTLKRIAVALERMADAWEKTPEPARKKSLFS